jgi:KaiC/GvpD/RAD55 family RecA-like ATPase
MAADRQKFGIESLDLSLGGGLLPGSLTVIAGATGAGKTQLGIQWAEGGLRNEGRRGVFCDMTSRGDSQNHAAYARERHGWTLEPFPVDAPFQFDQVWDFSKPIGDYFQPVRRAGRRVTRRDLDPDQWHEWKSDLARVLRVSAGFFYQNFIRGSRRVVFDGIEPTEAFSESIQFEYFEYLYHHVIRQDDDWAAREWLRENYRAHESQVLSHRYDHEKIGCLYLYTTPHIMLDELMAQPLGQGDIFSNANTIILMGRTRHEGRMGRALYVAKHRGSACSDAIHPYRITDRGLVLE